MKSSTHILVVDNRSHLGKTVQRQLCDKIPGANVIVTSDNSEAAVLLRRDNYDAMVWCVGPDAESKRHPPESLEELGPQTPILLVAKDTALSADPGGDFANVQVCEPGEIAEAVRKTVDLRIPGKDRSKLCIKRVGENPLDMMRVTAGTLYHEVSNPIMTILGMAELILDGDETLSPDIRDKIEAIQASAGRIQMTLNHLMQVDDAHFRDTASSYIVDHISGAVGSDLDD